MFLDPNYTITQQDLAAIVEVGEPSLTGGETINTFGEALNEAIKGMKLGANKPVKYLIVDMSKVEGAYADAAHKLLQANNRLFGEQEIRPSVMLAGMQPRVEEHFERMALTDNFEIYPDVDSALAACQRRREGKLYAVEQNEHNVVVTFHDQQLLDDVGINDMRSQLLAELEDMPPGNHPRSLILDISQIKKAGNAFYGMLRYAAALVDDSPAWQNRVTLISAEASKPKQVMQTSSMDREFDWQTRVDDALEAGRPPAQAPTESVDPQTLSQHQSPGPTADGPGTPG